MDPKLPTLFIVGDSTVHSTANGEVGWGDAISKLFDRTRINVDNRAAGSLSSRSFRGEGRWKLVLGDSKPGDFVLIQFGHYDSTSTDGDTAGGSFHGDGDEKKTVTKSTGATETIHTFGWYLKQYVTEAREKGMTPIICSYIPRCPRPSATSPATMPALPIKLASYSLWASEAAEDEHADFIDLNGLIWQHYSGFSPADLKKRFFTPVDFTHTSAEGAELNARCVVEGLQRLKDSPLNKYLVREAAAGSPDRSR